MSEKAMSFNAIVSGVATGLVYLFGGLDIALITLLIFIIIDYITGVTSSYLSHNWNSAKGYKGIAKKVGIMLLVIVAVQLDRLTNADALFRNLVCFFYIANEGLSILENLGKIGVPIPAKIKEALEQLK